MNRLSEVAGLVGASPHHIVVKQDATKILYKIIDNLSQSSYTLSQVFTIISRKDIEVPLFRLQVKSMVKLNKRRQEILSILDDQGEVGVDALAARRRGVIQHYQK